MRPFLLSILLLLSACGGPKAEVGGDAFGLTWGDTKSVYFGGPFLIVAANEIGCDQLAWVTRTYTEGEVPTDDDVTMIQFASQTGDLEANTFSIAVDASVSSTIVQVLDGAFVFERAASGILTVDDLDEDDSASGDFDTVVFDSGALSGKFTAEWCRNLKG